MGCGTSYTNIHEPRKNDNHHENVQSTERGFSNITFQSFDQLVLDYNYKKGAAKDAIGIVKKAQYIPSNSERGIKALKKTKINLETQMKKYDMLKSFNHSNLPTIYDLYEDEEFIYISMELCREELFDRILSQVCFPENESAIIIKQLLAAVSYIHQKNVIHRDIKLEHIMFIYQGTDLEIKLVGFSSAKILNPNQKLTEKVGSPFYVAPEIINGNYSFKSDVWACGVVLFMLLSGYPPFEGEAQDEILQKVEQGTIDFSAEEWDDISKEGKDFVKKLLTVNPNLRYSAEQALQDPWIQKFAQI